MRLRVIAVTGALGAALLLAACGGDGDSKQSKAEVVTQANAACREATAQSRTYVDARDAPSDTREISAALNEDARLARQVAAKLDKLDPESNERDQFDAFVVSTKAIAASNAEAAKAADSGTAQELKAASQKTLDETGPWKDAAKAYGLTNCPYTPVTAGFANEGDSQLDTGGDSGGDTSADSTDITGTWSGDVDQRGPGSKRLTYEAVVRVNATPDSAIGTINYPSLKCRGHLDFVKIQGNFTYVMLERITKRTKSCGGGGNVYLKRRGDQLNFHWTDRVGKDIVVDGRLDSSS